MTVEAAADAADTRLRDIGLRADVTRAATIVAPMWPLGSFVAVNPLGGLAHLPFDDAAAQARRWLGARTHLTLHEYRQAHARGAIANADLHRAVRDVVPGLDRLPCVTVAGEQFSAADIVARDLLHGPEAPPGLPVPTAGQQRRPGLDDRVAEGIDEHVAAWCAVYADEAGTPWQLPNREDGFYAAWRALAGRDRRLRSLVGAAGRQWLADLPERAEEALAAGLSALGVADERRVDELRAQIGRLPGWAYAHWHDEWAPSDHTALALHLIDLLAVRVSVEAAAVRSLPVPSSAAPPSVQSAPEDASLDARVSAVLALLGATGDHARRAVRDILGHVAEPQRLAIWLAAHEGNFRDRLLAAIGPDDAPPWDASVPDVQAAFCIDVRSEGMRRHLERLGSYETLGFAGFFGVPVRWMPLGSERAEARCPVLVTPRHDVAERPVAADDARAFLARARTREGAVAAFHAAKGGAASPFALAEAAGWLAGPAAAVRTLAPTRWRSIWPSRLTRRPRTRPAVAAEHDPASGLMAEERTLYAEAILSTMGLTKGFASLVVLCGHGSRTVNNPHASALDCGACGGAPGGPSARVAAAILNDPQVRADLAERGIAIPDATWFAAAEHDTASDQVAVLDRDTVPATHEDLMAAFERDLATAGSRLAAERARRLSGDPRRVRSRGDDWAQVRPEWGLAGNAAFVIGPRSVTRDVDLACRVFLHSYDADADSEGLALETIMTAPLVVAQWISAQYYFSSVDQQVFGAGDKTLHNPVGGIGVVTGEGGDLRVGLPQQSLAAGSRRMHEPLRLLAVVQAPLDRIDAIIRRNGVLWELVAGRWISVVGRESADGRWALRSPTGDWSGWCPADEQSGEGARSLEVR